MQSLIESRSLTSEVIVKTLVMALGALWNLRMYSQPLPGSSAQATQSQPSSRVTSSKHSEPFILAHILNLFRILMQVGVSEMQGVELSSATSPTAMGQQRSSLVLAQRITATFRRTLPALRIASKWLKCHLEYVKRSSPEADIAAPPTAFDAFWTTYAAFANALTRTFDDDDGLASCPPLTTRLEEDVDMQGFAPLKRSMFGTGQDVGDGTVEAFLKTVPSNVANALPEDAVHPNEEQLMRIGDLLVDAKFISQSPVSRLGNIPSSPTLRLTILTLSRLRRCIIGMRHFSLGRLMTGYPPRLNLWPPGQAVSVNSIIRLSATMRPIDQRWAVMTMMTTTSVRWMSEMMQSMIWKKRTTPRSARERTMIL